MAITFYDDILVPKVDFGNPVNTNKVSFAAGTTTSTSNYTLPLAVPDTNGKLLTTSSNGTLSWIGGVTTDYLSARSANLISNFNGMFGDNSNFSEFVFDTSIVKNSPASFKITGYSHNLATDEYIAVDPTERYELTTWARQSDSSGKYYMGIRCYDVDGNQIRIYNNSFQSGTLTQLTHDLIEGGTFITVTDFGLSNWHTGSLSYRRSLIFWNQTTNSGYTFPPETYSQAFYSNAYASGQGYNANGIANSGIHNDIHTIFLSEPWGGPTIPEGTQISNGNGYAGYLPASGIGGSDQFVYCMPSIKNDVLWTVWQKHTGYIEGVVSAGGNNFGATTQLANQHKFLIGTAKVKIGWHAHQNYVTGGNETTAYFTNLLFRRHKEYIAMPDVSDPSTGLDAELIGGMTVNNTKFGYLSGLNSDVQTQITQTVYNTTSNSNTLNAHTTAISAIQATLQDTTGGGGKGVYTDAGKVQTSSHLAVTATKAILQAGANTGYEAEESSPGTLTMSVQAGGSGNEVSVNAITIAGHSTFHNATTTFNQNTVFSLPAEFNSTVNFNSTVDLNGNATGISTNQVAEGSENLYYTDARAQTYLSGGSATTIETSGDVTVGGNLIVSGTQTQLNTTTLEVEDINIVVGKLATTSTLTNGAGLTFGAWSSGTIPTLTWDHASTRLSLNKDFYAPNIVTAEIRLDSVYPCRISSDDNIYFEIDGADSFEAQSTGIVVSGNITLTGTVDGIDIATDVAANTAKTGITSGQASAITANTAKISYSTAASDAVALNTAKTGITSSQASEITANTAKVTNVPTALSVVTANNKLWITSDGTTAIITGATNTSWGAMTDDHVIALAVNSAKTSFPGLGTTSTTALAGDTALLALGTTSTTALAGDTALLALGTSSTTALAGDTTTISSAQASAITANTAKVSNIVQTTITGNAGTATQLANTVTIGGRDFNGQNDVDLPGVNETGNQNTSGNAATATKIASITNTDIVQLAGAQTLSGVKTFSSSIVSPGITTANNGNIVIDPDGTGSITLRSDNIIFEGAGTMTLPSLKLSEATLLEGNYVGFAPPLSIVSNVLWTLPATDGTNGQVMKTSGAGVLSWASVLSGTNDTLLGITKVKPNAGLDGGIAFYEDANVNYVLLQAHDDLASNYTLRLPTADGSADQTLKTDGSGNLGWSTPSSGGGAVDLPLMTLGGRVQHSVSDSSKMIICGGTYGPTYYVWSASAGVTASSGGTVDSTTLTLPSAYQYYGAIRVPTSGQIKVDFLSRPLNGFGYSKPYVLQLWEFTPSINSSTGPTCTLRAKVNMTSSISTLKIAEATVTSTSDIAAGSYIFVTIGMDAQTLTSTAYQYMNINLSILA